MGTVLDRWETRTRTSRTRTRVQTTRTTTTQATLVIDPGRQKSLPTMPCPPHRLGPCTLLRTMPCTPMPWFTIITTITSCRLIFLPSSPSSTSTRTFLPRTPRRQRVPQSRPLRQVATLRPVLSKGIRSSPVLRWLLLNTHQASTLVATW